MRLLQPPSGFDWNPPVRAYWTEQDGYFTNYSSADFMPETTAEIWVSPTGNDTTGTGTEGAPYRTILKGLDQAALLADAGVHLRIVAGTYTQPQCWANRSPDKNLVVTAEGGQVISSTRVSSITWALQGDGTWRATRSNVASVVDATNLDSNGRPIRLVAVANQAACAATLNTYYADGTAIFVNTFDSRQPTLSDLWVMLGVTNGHHVVDKTYYIKGVVFEGASANGPFNTLPANGAGGALIFEDCVFRYSHETGANTNGLQVFGVNSVICVRCESYQNRMDGFNYHAGTVNGVNPEVVEIDCIAEDNGTQDGVNNDNGSTTHDAVRIMRVNTRSARNAGPCFADVGTAHVWNIGCVGEDSEASGVGTQNSGYYAGTSARMWLDGCTAAGSDYSAVAADSAQIRYRGGSLSGLMSGDVATY